MILSGNNTRKIGGSILMVAFILFLITACGSGRDANYDESKVPEYELPELLVCEDGENVKTQHVWLEKRREEILALFESEMYGVFPVEEYQIKLELKALEKDFLEGRAVLKEILCTVQTEEGEMSFTNLIILPHSEEQVPVFIALNFYGNHTIDSCSEISLHKAWSMNNDRFGITENRASKESRGIRASRWPISTLINKGYGLSTVYYGELCPDYEEGVDIGLGPLFAGTQNAENGDASGAISIWAKGMSIMVDILYSEPMVDIDRIVALGHSRLGKTALWSGVNDNRFAAAISNNSGCGGAALSRREFGETVQGINTMFPHWFCDNFKGYNRRVRKLPIDQHMLLGLMAPRPVYVASASKDQWADPRGEFLALKETVPAYELFGYRQDFPQTQPEPGHPYFGITGYHIRDGKHDITEEDWVNYMSWCNFWLSER